VQTFLSDEQPVVPVYAGYNLAEVKRALKRKEEPSYMGTFTSARRYVLHTFATTQSAQMKKRVAQYLLSTQCPQCDGKRLRREALSVTFAGLDIGELSRRPLDEVAELLRPAAEATPSNSTRKGARQHPEQVIAAQRIAADLRARIAVVQALGLGYLSLERSTPTLSPGELQRLRLATQIRSQLFGVVYVMDEPSAGLHPADAQALLGALDQLKAAGNSVFVVEHEVDVIRHADWIVDVGPAAGVQGGQVLYSGPPAGLEQVQASSTRRYLFGAPPQVHRHARVASAWLQLRGITRNNVRALDVDLPLGVFTTVTGVSGSGKSSLVSQALVELLAAHLGQAQAEDEDALDPLERGTQVPLGGAIVAGLDQVRRLVRVDQKPIGRTPRSNLATYTGLFDPVRKLFAATSAARRRRYDPGQFSFNVAKGRCATCEGEGSVYVELLFMPSVYAPCPTCHGARYNAKTLEIALRGRNIAQVLEMTVDQAAGFFADDASVLRPLQVLREVGLGYLRLGQPATELSGGEAQRIKLATELQRAQRRDTVYVLDEPTTGLHPSDVDTLMGQLQGLVDAGNTVIVVEHDMRVAASSDWVLEMGPGAGDAGGNVVVAGTPAAVAQYVKSRTAAFLAPLIV
ncbi:excinuclease ABC subunit UvrA, partial [Xanthomonas phaseoli pv. dieffenbachiae]|uniref:excinuclease ABC subunit UvrA n=2 Tax=Xanthomonas phaseoli TaxID=1985254 RepID=UPI001ADBA087